MLNEFSRTQLLLGKAAMEELKDARVAVFGIGGVGGYVCEALVRSGVGHFDLIDDDRVCLTNINRQIHALRSTVGKYKAEVMKARMLDINPEADITTHLCFFLPETAADFDFSSYDYVVDAVDTVTAKIQIIMQAKESGVPVISCMGAGNKLDPTALHVADIYRTSVDPLAKVMRRELKKRGVKKLKCVYSTEKPVRPLTDMSVSCRTHCICPPGTARKCTERRDIPGSTSFVPPAAGLIIASEIVKDLTIRKKKVLFFDIDGTLIDFQSRMPGTARTALRKAARNGHRLILCTGRSFCQLDPKLLQMGFDGVVAAAGADVLYGDVEISHETFGAGRISRIIDFFLENKIPFLFQQKDGCVIQASCVRGMAEGMKERFGGHVSEDHAEQQLRASIGSLVTDPDMSLHKEDFSGTETVLYCNSPVPNEAIIKLAQPLGLTVSDTSFKTPDNFSGEITVKGVTKATGMEKMLDYLHTDRRDSIAFGDGPNDINMMEYAGLSVAMGNGTEEVKKAADYVTKDVDKDGLYAAMERLGLIT